MYTLTVEPINIYTNEAALNAITRAFYIDGSTEIDLTPISYGVYEVAPGTEVLLRFGGADYEYAAAAVTVSADGTTYQQSLTPIYTIRRQWRKYTSSATTLVFDPYVASLYRFDDPDWTLIETHNINNNDSYYYFNATLDSNATYKVELSSSTYWDKNYSGKGSAIARTTPPTTWYRNHTLVTVRNARDGITGNIITLDSRKVYNQAVRVSSDYGDNWAEGNFHPYISNGVLLNRSVTNYKMAAKCVCTKSDYLDDVQIHDFGPGSTEIESYYFEPVLFPVPEFTVEPLDAITGDPIEDFTATLSLNGSVLETSTTGYFYTVLDGTSVYTLTIESAGYHTAILEGVSFPLTVSMAPIKTVAFTGAVRNLYTNLNISNHEYQVYRYDGQDKVYAPSTGTDQFECETGYTWYYVLTAPGYLSTSEESLGVVTDDITITTVMRLTPDADVICRAMTYTDESTTAPLSDRTSTLYKKVGNDWTAIETHVYGASASTNYWIGKGTLDPSSEYRFEITSPTTYPLVISFTTDSEGNPSGSWGSSAWYYTHNTDTWLINASAKNAVTHEAINPSYIYEYDESDDNWTSLTYISNLGGVLVKGSGDTEYRLRITATLTAYETTIAVQDLGTISDPEVPMESYTVNVSMMPIPTYTQMTLSISDSRHGTPIDDATIVVTDQTTGDVIIPESGVYSLVYNLGHSFAVSITKTEYESYNTVVTPVDDTPIELTVSLVKVLRYCRLYVTAKNWKGAVLDANLAVYDEYTDTYVTKTGDHWNLICNDDEPYHVEATCSGYYPYTSDTFVPDSDDDIHMDFVMDKISVYASLYVTIRDTDTDEIIPDAEVDVYDLTSQEAVEPTGDHWMLLAEEDHEYRITYSADNYYTHEPAIITANKPGVIRKTYKLDPKMTDLYVIVQDIGLGEPAVGATIVVMDDTTHTEIIPTGDRYRLPIGDDNYKVSVSKPGYTSDETDLFKATDRTDIYKTLYISYLFASVSDYAEVTGKDLTPEEIERLNMLLPLVSNLIRNEGRKAGVNVDAAILLDPVYADIVKMVTIDVTSRYLRQDTTGEAMSQESQSALGYTWSGTYAVPGGGLAMSLMRNEMARLGFSRQKIGGIQLWHAES